MDRQVLIFINPFDGLIHVSHVCKTGREEAVLPFPFWHVDNDGMLAVGCKLYCDPASSGCGLLLERVPLTGVPQEPSKSPKSRARMGILRRTLSAWRRGKT
jgi:hypothetical protein